MPPTDKLTPDQMTLFYGFMSDLYAQFVCARGREPLPPDLAARLLARTDAQTAAVAVALALHPDSGTTGL